MSRYDMAYYLLYVDVYVSVFVTEDYESLVIVQNRVTTWQQEIPTLQLVLQSQPFPEKKLHSKHIQQNHNFPNVSQGLSCITANEWKGYL